MERIKFQVAHNGKLTNYIS